MNEKCDNCRFFKSGFCKKKQFKVSVNSMWCKSFKPRLLIRIKYFLNNRVN